MRSPIPSPTSSATPPTTASKPAAEREAAGKSPRGTIRLNAYHDGDQVVIEVSDDGHGLDREKIVRRAIERGLLSAEEATQLNEMEESPIDFRSGPQHRGRSHRDFRTRCRSRRSQIFARSLEGHG